MGSRHLPYAAVALAIGVAAGCSDPATGGGGGSSTNADCTEGSSCVNRECVELCNTDRQCSGDDVCRRGICVADSCGDGVIDELEECDDGAANDAQLPDACRLDCSAAFCGDGVVDTGEQCDDGDNAGGYGLCEPDCTLGLHCGDSVTSNGEECDNGTANADANTNSESCKYGEMSCTVCDQACVSRPGEVSFCGDGITQTVHGEICDDGAANADGWALHPHCNATCTGTEPYCGDGMTTAPEECDDGASTTCMWADAGQTACQHVVYVDPSARGAENGSTWADAYRTVRDAMFAAQPGQELWVVAGVHTPGFTHLWSFGLRDDVALFGGFAGDETQRDQRDFVNNETILSGDLS